MWLQFPIIMGMGLSFLVWWWFELRSLVVLCKQPLAILINKDKRVCQDVVPKSQLSHQSKVWLKWFYYSILQKLYPYYLSSEQWWKKLWNVSTREKCNRNAHRTPPISALYLLGFTCVDISLLTIGSKHPFSWMLSSFFFWGLNRTHTFYSLICWFGPWAAVLTFPSTCLSWLASI